MLAPFRARHHLTIDGNSERLAGHQNWLAEIGFLPGESVRVIARGAPGGDPLVVRIGDSTFALRKAEAACIRVLPAAGEGAA